MNDCTNYSICIHKFKTLHIMLILYYACYAIRFFFFFFFFFEYDFEEFYIEYALTCLKGLLTVQLIISDFEYSTFEW